MTSFLLFCGGFWLGATLSAVGLLMIFVQELTADETTPPPIPTIKPSREPDFWSVAETEGVEYRFLGVTGEER